ncbi:phage tail family protein [Bacillus pumilus]|uniref:phage tail domain-containing protein n=1 Tax=Bacillus pumilus TaxID=1408 RepID=UPI0029C4A9F6|nr:phage tail domain-containing protein [Bacillus pumilus]MDX5483654.1 phage tail family protein [Bacillus pumilus]
MSYEFYTDYGEGLQLISEHLPFLRCVKFTPVSASIERQTAVVANRPGLKQTSKKVRFKERKIKARFYIKAKSTDQFNRYRAALTRELVREEPYYISCSFSPGIRYLVTCDDEIEIEKDDGKNYKEVDVEFTASLGLGETVFNTEKPLNLSGEYFYLGMNLPSQDDLKYRFTSKTFKVYNASDVTIDPIDFDYSVTMYLTGKDVKIRNDATKEALTISGSVSKKQKIIITRQYVTIDGKMADTSGRFPSLRPGFNPFEIEGASSIDIRFVLRFYYK